MFWMRNAKVDSWKFLSRSVIPLLNVRYGNPTYQAFVTDRNPCIIEFGALETTQ